MNHMLPTRRLLWLAATISLILALVACGGTAVPALELASHTPSADATGVLLADTIELNFNEAVAAQTVTPSTLMVLDGSNELSYDKAFSGNGKTITLTLTSSPASLPANLTVQIDGIENTRGASLTTSFSFTTADDWVELGSLVQADSSNDADSPSIAMDASGNLVVAFSSGEASGYRIAVRRWNGSAWESVGGPFNSGSSDSAFDPDLELDPDGNPVVAFRELSSTNNDNVFVRHWNGSAWVSYGSDAALDRTLSDKATNPSLDLASNGKPGVFFSELSTVAGTAAYRVYRSGYTDSLGWVAITDPDNFDSNRDAIEPVFKLDSSDHAILSWVETTATGKAIYVKDVSSGNFLGSPADTREASDDYIPYLAMELDSNDNPVIVWREQSNSSGIFAKYWDGTAWKNYGGTDLVNAGGYRVALDLDPQGQPVIATMVGGHLIVMHWNGSAWDTYADEVNIDFSQDLYSFDLAANASGNPIVVWSEDDASGEYVLHAKVYNGLKN